MKSLRNVQFTNKHFQYIEEEDKATSVQCFLLSKQTKLLKTVMLGHCTLTVDLCVISVVEVTLQNFFIYKSNYFIL